VSQTWVKLPYVAGGAPSVTIDLEKVVAFTVYDLSAVDQGPAAKFVIAFTLCVPPTTTATFETAEERQEWIRLYFARDWE
jgi:hypothetical protein